MNISFKQYLILRKLYKTMPNKVQLDVNSKDFEYLMNCKYITSDQDCSKKTFLNVPTIFATDNGLSTITDEGISTYHSYLDIYLTRVKATIALALSVVSIIASAYTFIKAIILKQ